MFDNLFPLIGHSGAAVVFFFSVTGVIFTVALSELLGASFRARRLSRHV